MTTSPLAVLGGTPAFREILHVGRPNIGDRSRFLALVNEVLDRRLLTNSGPVVEAFETALSLRLGVRHCVVVSNATVGLELAYAECGLTGEVIVPSFTFVATAHALLRSGCTPVFCDIDPATHCVDPAQVESLVTERTGGIAAVHLWGHVCNTEVLEAVAEAHGLPIVYDAAHAFGCRVRGRSVASSGNASVFSFHATKVLNSFEGGAITTDDRDLAERLRLARSFGFSGHDDVVRMGTNAKLPEVSAAMGLVNLESFDAFVAVNRRNHAVYRAVLSGLPGVRLISFDGEDAPNYQYVVLEVDPGEAGLTRDEVMAVLRAENVFARRYFWPGVHRMEPYRTMFPDVARSLPVTEAVAARVLVLPTGTAVDESTARRVAEIVRTALELPSRVRTALARVPAAQL